MCTAADRPVPGRDYRRGVWVVAAAAVARGQLEEQGDCACDGTPISCLSPQGRQEGTLRPLVTRASSLHRSGRHDGDAESQTKLRILHGAQVPPYWRCSPHW